MINTLITVKLFKLFKSLKIPEYFERDTAQNAALLDNPNPNKPVRLPSHGG